EYAIVGEAIAIDVKYADIRIAADRAHHAGVEDIQPFLIRGKTDSVRAAKPACHHRRSARARIEPVHLWRQLELHTMAFVIAEIAEIRIGEPDRAIRRHDNIIGRVERFALEFVDQDRDAAVMFGARDAPRTVLAGDQAALPIE